MERYTYYDGGNWRLKLGDTEYRGDWVDRLAAYEETGLEPEELAHLLMGHGTFECPVCEIGDQRKCDTECEKHCVKWLQQPAEEER